MAHVSMFTVLNSYAGVWFSATQDRNRLLEAAATKGVILNYGGSRVSVAGKPFKIRNVTLFNIVDAAGWQKGQGQHIREQGRNRECEIE